jgi:site-specific DNA-methyltransferase (adenine-specific)
MLEVDWPVGNVGSAISHNDSLLESGNTTGRSRSVLVSPSQIGVQIMTLAIDQVYLGNCLDLLAELDDNSIDMALCDLPYGATQNRWDTVIDLDALWLAYKRVCKPNAALVFTATMPFTARLGASNLPWLRYAWVWHKNWVTGHLNAHRMPMRDYEDILVFYKEQPVYRPQGLRAYNQIERRGNNGSNYGVSGTENFQEWTNYPRMVLEFSRDPGSTHPTQKPVALFEYLIRTYTDEGALVLDNCMGSGTTAVACIQSGRHYIGMELNERYFNEANLRIMGVRT